ncbi:unnamed protein product, partial [Prorocentrum cordatum]
DEERPVLSNGSVGALKAECDAGKKLAFRELGDGSGLVSFEGLRRALTNFGEKLDPEVVDAMMNERGSII